MTVDVREGGFTVLIRLAYWFQDRRPTQNLRDTKSGFKNIEHLLSFQVAPALNGYTLQRAKWHKKNPAETDVETVCGTFAVPHLL